MRPLLFDTEFILVIQILDALLDKDHRRAFIEPLLVDRLDPGHCGSSAPNQQRFVPLHGAAGPHAPCEGFRRTEIRVGAITSEDLFWVPWVEEDEMVAVPEWLVRFGRNVWEVGAIACWDGGVEASEMVHVKGGLGDEVLVGGDPMVERCESGR